MLQGGEVMKCFRECGVIALPESREVELQRELHDRIGKDHDDRCDECRLKDGWVIRAETRTKYQPAEVLKSEEGSE